MIRTSAVLLALTLAACGTDDPVAEQMTISAYKLAGDCRQFVSNSDVLPSGITPSFKACGDNSDGTFIAGSDQITLVVSYGGLTFDDSTAVTGPSAMLTVDGVAATPSVATVSQRAGHAAFFEMTFRAPSNPGGQLSIGAQGATGFTRILSSTFPLIAPSLSVRAEQCDGQATGCSAVAAVGNLALHVTAVAVTQQSVTITSIVDGISQSAPIPLDLKTPTSGSTIEGVTYLPIPAATEWTLEAALSTSTASLTISLSSPLPSASLACGTSCVAGKQTTLTISAPLHISSAIANVSTIVDGVPDLTGATVNLTTPDLSAGAITGTLGITLPVAGSSLVINGLVDGYPFNTITLAF